MWRLRAAMLFLQIVWRPFTTDADGNPIRLSIGDAWSVAVIACKPAEVV